MRKYYRKNEHYYSIDEVHILHVKYGKCVNTIPIIADFLGEDELFLKRTENKVKLSPSTEEINEESFIWALKNTLNSLFFNNKQLEKLNTLKHKF